MLYLGEDLGNITCEVRLGENFKRNHNPSRILTVCRSVYLRITDSGRENGTRITSVLGLSDLM